jgi:hypothetical protein
MANSLGDPRGARGVHSIIQADAASRRGLIQALGGKRVFAEIRVDGRVLFAHKLPFPFVRLRVRHVA